VDRLRGTGGDLVILEEAAFIDESVFNEVVIPLLEVSNTALVGISTPQDKNNYYSSLVHLEDDHGNRVFHVFEAKNACDKCIAELKDPSKCPHVALDRPAWKSKEKQRIVQALYKNNQTLLLRESMGIITDDSSGLFDKQAIQALLQAPRVAPATGSNCVFLAIDPNGGGGSKFAICSGIRHQGTFMVGSAPNPTGVQYAQYRVRICVVKCTRSTRPMSSAFVVMLPVSRLSVKGTSPCEINRRSAFTSALRLRT
jgi:hypothetical protein